MARDGKTITVAPALDDADSAGADAPAPASLGEARAQAAALDDAPKPKPRARTAKKRTRKPRADAAPRSAPRPSSLRVRLRDSISTLGAMVSLISAKDGALIIAGAEKQAAALDTLAKENPVIRAALERMLTASIYGQLIAAFAPTILGIAANHQMLPGPANALVQLATAPMPRGDGEGSTSLLDGIDLATMTAMATAFGGSGDGAPFGAIAGMG